MMNENCAALGMLEFTGIASGMEAADRMVKAAEVEPLFFKTVCPGKFLAAVAGDVAAVSASVEAGRAVAPHTVADWFLIPNIHREVIAALAGTGAQVDRAALGIIETFSAASLISAADAAVKAAEVRIMDVRIALGLGGKGYALFCGDVAAVQAAVEAGAQRASESGLFVAKVVIPRPAESFFEQLL
jgi:microcompartment protein CcmL/EutN